MEASQRQLANDRGRNRPFQKLGANRLGKAALARADSLEERACDCSTAASRFAPLAAAHSTINPYLVRRTARSASLPGSARASRALCGASPQSVRSRGYAFFRIPSVKKFAVARRHRQHASRVRSPEIANTVPNSAQHCANFWPNEIAHAAKSAVRMAGAARRTVRRGISHANDSTGRSIPARAFRTAERPGEPKPPG
jgi:hypothetical protein